jgi:hypothetical protein
MVELHKKKLGELMASIKINNLSGTLAIPDYQRIYCWPEKNVRLLLDDLLLLDHSNHPYHLGTIIVQYGKIDGVGKWNLIDGQQRMVTLSLLLLELGDRSSPLLNERFKSKEANDFIAYNRYLIRSFIQQRGWEDKKEDKGRHANRLQIVKKLKEETTFDTLFLTDESLDLAYTFFSAQNDRGKPLTDYELLKSHHLRFIPWEEQQMHLAKKWDSLLLRHESELGDKSVSIVVGHYLYCLRKWTMMDECDPDANKAIKTEFESAAVIDAVPPFGEKFNYNEAIQGGSHFFAFVEHFVRKYQLFTHTKAYQALWYTISCSGQIVKPTFENKVLCEDELRPVENKKRTHWWYGDVIAAFLFAYYLKFGEEYIAEALTCITRMISKIRYDKSKANLSTLYQYAGDSRIVLLLNRATSPTFFLAEMKSRISYLPVVNDFNNNGNRTIRDDYMSLEKKLYKIIEEDYLLSFQSLHIK